MNVNLKIVLISSHAPSLLSFRKYLIKALIGLKHEVYAIAPNFTPSSRKQLEALGAIAIDCEFQRSGMNPVHDFLSTIKLSRIIKSINPDITLGYFIKPVIFGTIAAWFARVPRRIAMVEGLGYVFTPNSEKLTFKRRLLKYVVMWLYRLAFSKAHKVVFLNEDDKNELVNLKLISPNKSYVLGGIGVDLSEWVEHIPPTDPVTFILVARLLREKGVLEYAAAAKIIKLKFPQVNFIILGGIDENPGAITEECVSTWVSDGILDWHGHVPVQPWLAESSVFVLPSYREGVPCSTQEALAMGRAIITTDVPGCRETVVHRVNGFLIPPRNVQALADSMEEFINKPILITQMGKESRRLAEQRFDEVSVNDRLINLLLDCKQPMIEPYCND